MYGLEQIKRMNAVPKHAEPDPNDGLLEWELFLLDVVQDSHNGKYRDRGRHE